MSGILFMGMAVLLYVSTDAFWGLLRRPSCTLNTVTGLQCPVCGGTRALEYLLAGEFKLAWRHNPLVVALLPLGGLFWGYLGYLFARRRPLTSISLSPYWIWVLFVVIVLFGIIRNIPHPLFEPLRVPPAALI